MANSTAPGWAIRRSGTCLSGLETDCGATYAPFRGCCPMEFACPNQYNVACCPSGSNCTSSLLNPSVTPEVKCANTTWDLFDNNGYFCCEQGLKAYNNIRTNSNICAGVGFEPGSSASALPLLKAGISMTATATETLAQTSSSPTTSATADLATPSHSDAVSPGSGKPVGAIVGGVVAGIALLAIIGVLAWFILRRRRQEGQRQLEIPPQHEYEMPQQNVRYRYKEQAYVHEVADYEIYEAGNGIIKELPVQQSRAELPGSYK